MLSFYNKPELKDYFVKNAKWHQEQDRFVQGQDEYDKDKKGCMIACSFKNYDHKLGEEESGVPEWILKLADSIFEASYEEINES